MKLSPGRAIRINAYRKIRELGYDISTAVDAADRVVRLWRQNNGHIESLQSVIHELSETKRKKD